MPFEILYGAFVLLRRSTGIECSQIPSFSVFWIFLPGIEAVSAGCKLSYHVMKPSTTRNNGKRSACPTIQPTLLEVRRVAFEELAALGIAGEFASSAAFTNWQYGVRYGTIYVGYHA